VQGGLKALYVPLEVREQVPSRAVKAQTLGVFGESTKSDEKVKLAQALEMGRIVSRDIGGSDPERMAAPR
jgi:leucyl aminopeptidase